MLLNLLKSWSRARRRPPSVSDDEYPDERVARLQRAHARAPVAAHRDILYRDLAVGGHGLGDLLEQALRASRVKLDPPKALHRPLASFFLIQYFLYSLELQGERAECGVFGGTSALLMCLAARTRDPGYRGTGLHLIDSFEGLSEPTAADVFAVRNDGGAGLVGRSWAQGEFLAPIEYARAALRDFPQAAFHRGWIPQVLGTLPETRWSFVHLDVDLYAPTLESLRYFYPRLTPGGVMVCDDYGAPLFPGAHRAWDEYCDEHDVPYVVLDTGQSVILKV